MKAETEAWMVAAVAAYTRLGAVVHVDPEGENFVRAVAGGGFEVQVQGLPNLVHELVHTLACGRLADDHGFDYGAIPLDLRDPRHRAYLWEELLACAKSCAVLPGRDREPWFAEQFEIQGVFHGLEHDHAALRSRVDGAFLQHRAECAVVERRIDLALEAALPGFPRVELAAAWAQYLAGS